MISQVYLMSNGMTVVFDGKDQQVPELQGHWDSVKAKLFEVLLKQAFKPTFYDQNAFERMQDETFAIASNRKPETKE